MHHNRWGQGLKIEAALQMTKVCLTSLPLHLWRVLVSKNAMSDHEVLAPEVPGGVVL